MNDLKKVLLAGIGLTAMTVDKADSFVKELVEKGRLTKLSALSTVIAVNPIPAKRTFFKSFIIVTSI